MLYISVTARSASHSMPMTGVPIRLSRQRRPGLGECRRAGKDAVGDRCRHLPPRVDCALRGAAEVQSSRKPQSRLYAGKRARFPDQDVTPDAPERQWVCQPAPPTLTGARRPTPRWSLRLIRAGAWLRPLSANYIQAMEIRVLGPFELVTDDDLTLRQRFTQPSGADRYRCPHVPSPACRTVDAHKADTRFAGANRPGSVAKLEPLTLGAHGNGCWCAAGAPRARSC